MLLISNNKDSQPKHFNLDSIQGVSIFIFSPRFLFSYPKPLTIPTTLFLINCLILLSYIKFSYLSTRVVGSESFSKPPQTYCTIFNVST